MNIRELLDTLEVKIDLMASQRTQGDRQHIRKEIKDHLDDVRDNLGLPHDVPCCCGCGGDPLQQTLRTTALDAGCDSHRCRRIAVRLPQEEGQEVAA